MKVVFLDIDGVLNSDKYFETNQDEVNKYYRDNKINGTSISVSDRIIRQMMDIDMNKFIMLKDVVNQFNIKVVIISSWKKLSIYPQLKEILISMGLPVIGETIDKGSDRGNGIKNYLLTHDVTDYVILDDDIFDDYDDTIMAKLIKTSFIDGGLKEEHIDILINKFGNNNVKKK